MERVKNIVLKHVSILIGVNESEIDLNESFDSFGIESMGMINLNKDICKDLGINDTFIGLSSDIINDYIKEAFEKSKK